MVEQMTGSSYSSSITRRFFIEKSVKGTTALALSGLVLFMPKGAAAADRSPLFVNIPSPQFPAWTPDGKLLVTFIAEDEPSPSSQQQTHGTATRRRRNSTGSEEIPADSVAAYYHRSRRRNPRRSILTISTRSRRPPVWSTWM